MKRQTDAYEFKASLVYVASSRLAKAICKMLSQNKTANRQRVQMKISRDCQGGSREEQGSGDTSCAGLKKLRALTARRAPQSCHKAQSFRHPRLRAVAPVTVEDWDPGTQA